MKIIGVGLQKTGTTTLGTSLKLMGYKHQSYSVRAAEMYSHGSIAELLIWAERYESFDDVPWALLYRELDQRHPGSKFILTRRRSVDAWFNSLRKHVERLGRKSATPEMNRTIYGRPDPQNDRDTAIAVYQSHLDAVRQYFAGRPGDFVELCWEDGDGWEQLATFLGRPPPSLPFPHANKAPSLWQNLRERWRNRHRKAVVTPATPRHWDR